MAQVKTRPRKAAVARKVAPARNGHAGTPARAERLSPAMPRPGEDEYREQIKWSKWTCLYLREKFRIYI